MSQLIINLPSERVWVRKEYLRDHQDGHGEFVEGVWISCKSIPGGRSTSRLISRSMAPFIISCQLVPL